MRACNPTLVLLSLLLLVIASCEQEPTESPIGTLPEGSYRYTAYDEKGTLAVRGWLTIEFDDSHGLHGEWHSVEVGDASRMGPQVGDGKLVGSAEDGQAWIDLNPQYRDNNVVLNGSISRSSFKGIWTWSTFVGVTSQGRFEAVR